jgi:hypothetical protein
MYAPTKSLAEKNPRGPLLFIAPPTKYCAKRQRREFSSKCAATESVDTWQYQRVLSTKQFGEKTDMPRNI